ncbi:MAG: symmetrical bis(5'-nucleosyl)-tetraphosphatase [Gammaproteobacteria bacterium]|nr:symmetrical bis(5'-nucleosyl)-tetraphosphatase [Gammaproteobacteria bacterium]
MTTFAIGDIHGCYQELLKLLDKINYDQTKDQLWFVGDLVNRGPDSLKVLRFIKNQPNTVVTLGNHDLHLISLFYNACPLNKKHTVDEVLNAKDAEELINWLKSQKLIHYDKNLNCVMSHAGIYPGWDLNQALFLAKEVEKELQADNPKDFLHNMYGNLPDKWHDNLTGIERLRFILNALVRMRYCDKVLHLDLVETEEPQIAPKHLIPWFEAPNRKPITANIIFGHWASLRKYKTPNKIYALDTGCVYGDTLTALRLNNKIIKVYCCY